MGGLLASLIVVVLQNGPEAQPTTRAALIEQQRADKASRLTPLQASQIERVMFAIEDDFLIERWFNAPRGPFVRFGGFPTGAGISVGPAYRHTDQNAAATVWGAVSQKLYWEIGGSLAFPELAFGHAFADITMLRHEFPEEDFYGLGPESQPSDKTSFSLQETSVSITAGVNPVWWLRAAGTVEHLRPRVGTGRDQTVPSAEDLFPHVSPAPDASQPDYLRLGAYVNLDSTGHPFGAPYGGRYRFAYDHYGDFGVGLSSFNRWEVDLRQYLSVLGSTRTLALRAQAIALTPLTGEMVPFYMQPTLGGPDSLRGLEPYRLRDQSLVLVQSEYRWDVNAFMGGVVFYDAGTVAPRLGDLRLDRMIQDFGIGVRFGFLSTVSLRIEAAFGSGEGTVFLFRFGDVF